MEQPQKPTSFTFTLSDNWTQYVMDCIAERPAKECLLIMDFFRSEISRQINAVQRPDPLFRAPSPASEPVPTPEAPVASE